MYTQQPAAKLGQKWKFAQKRKFGPSIRSIPLSFLYDTVTAFLSHAEVRKILKRKHQKLLSPLYSLLPRYVTLRNGEAKLYTPRGEKKKTPPKQPKFKTFKSLKGKACKTNVTWFYFRVDIFPSSCKPPKLGEIKKNISETGSLLCLGPCKISPLQKSLKKHLRKQVTSFRQRKGGREKLQPLPFLEFRVVETPLVPNIGHRDIRFACEMAN